MRQLGGDPLAVAAGALEQGCAALCVTLGIRGAVYFEQVIDAKTRRRVGPIRTARIAVPVAGGVPSDGGEGDPTGCGDVFGATVAARLLQGAPLEEAIREGCRLAARNVSYGGARGLRQHLVGRLAGVCPAWSRFPPISTTAPSTSSPGRTPRPAPTVGGSGCYSTPTRPTGPPPTGWWGCSRPGRRRAPPAASGRCSRLPPTPTC